MTDATCNQGTDFRAKKLSFKRLCLAGSIQVKNVNDNDEFEKKVEKGGDFPPHIDKIVS